MRFSVAKEIRRRLSSGSSQVRNQALHGQLSKIDFENISLSQAATVVRSTYNTDHRDEVLQRIPQKYIMPKSVHLFLTPETEMQLREIFQHIDIDQSDSINLDEMVDGFRAMKVSLTRTEIQCILSKTDRESDIDFDEFATLMLRVEIKLIHEKAAQRNADRLKKEARKMKEKRLLESCCYRLYDACTRDLHIARAKVWALVDDPGSSTLAGIFSVIILLIIVLSCTTFMIESSGLLYSFSNVDTVFRIVEKVSGFIFSIEFILRILSCPSLLRFISSPLNWVDLIAVIPFWIEEYALLMTDHSLSFNGSSLRVVRLVRIFRVLKIGRYFRWMRVFIATIEQSIFPLGMVLLIIIIGLVTFSALLYYAERGKWDDDLQYFVKTINGVQNRTQFDSIPSTFWFVMSTLTTVGYGDMQPTTTLGRCFSIVTAIFGILVMAIPISILSTNFRVEYERMKNRLEIEKEQIVRQSLSPDEVLEQINMNKHLQMVISDTQSFALAAVADSCLHEHQSFALSAYKTCRTNQKRIFKDLRHKERDNRHHLLENLCNIQKQYLDLRKIEGFDTDIDPEVARSIMSPTGPHSLDLNQGAGALSANPELGQSPPKRLPTPDNHPKKPSREQAQSVDLSPLTDDKEVNDLLKELDLI